VGSPVTSGPFRSIRDQFRSANPEASQDSELSDTVDAHVILVMISGEALKN
jgi:hypothetical protein